MHHQPISRSREETILLLGINVDCSVGQFSLVRNGTVILGTRHVSPWTSTATALKWFANR